MATRGPVDIDLTTGEVTPTAKRTPRKRSAGVPLAEASGGVPLYSEAAAPRPERPTAQWLMRQGERGPGPVNPRGMQPYRQPPSKRQQAEAAVAQMRQAEGKPLSASQQAAAQAVGAWNQADQARALANTRVARSYRNPNYGAVKEHIGESEQAQTQVFQGQQGEYQAGLLHEQQVEDFRARVSLEQEMVNAGIQAKESARQDALAESTEAVKEASNVVTQTAEAFSRTPGIDPNRFWADKTAGQKFGAVILSVVNGIFTGDGPMGMLQESISRDIDAQKEDFSRKQAMFGAQMDSLTAQQGSYRSVLAQIDDERTADQVYQLARLEQAEREFEYWMQKGRVGQMTAAQQTFMGQLRQAKADLALQVHQRTSNNPRTITKIRHALSKGQRDALNKRADKLEDFALAVGKKGIEQAGALEGDLVKSRAASANKMREKQAEEDSGGAKELLKDEKYQQAQTAISIIDKMLGMAEKSGGGVPGQWGPFTGEDVLESEDAEDFRIQQDLLQGVATNWLTGAKAADYEKEAIDRAVGKGTWSGGQTKRALETSRRMFQDYLDNKERALTEGKRKSYYRNPNAPELAPGWQSSGMPSSYTPDE